MAEDTKPAEKKSTIQRNETHAFTQSLADFIVKLNIINIDEAKISLSQAGHRSSTSLTTYLAGHVFGPIAMLIVGYYLAYSGLAMGESSPNMALLMTLGMGVFGFMLPKTIINNQKSKRQLELRLIFPDSLDLMLICVEAGMTIEHAMRKVAQEFALVSPLLVSEITITLAELSYLSDRRLAYQNFAMRTGIDSIKNTCTALIQAERFGSSVGSTLRNISDEVRGDRMAAAEKKAAALPPLLTLPMMVFFMPVLLVVILAPAGLQILETLSN